MSSKQHKKKNSDLLIPPILLLLCLVPYVGAQSSSPPPAYPYADFNPSIIAIIVILIAALFLMGFFSIYIRRRANDSVSSSIRRALSIRRPPRGLDPSVIDTFPTFVYSSVKGLKIGKGSLECAVCLNEYQDEETLRLIPTCDHVFHPECIDAWFQNHATCPVCRADLRPGSELVNDSVSVVVQDPVVNVEQDPVEPCEPVEPVNRGQTPSTRLVGTKFRSHSTGHSLVQPGENLDRFTLRLPEDVRKQVVNRALLNRTGRLVGEGSGKKGYRTASGRVKSYKRMESLDRVVVRSERWVLPRAPSFLTRAFSIRSPRVLSGNGESSLAKTTDTIPLNNMGPKSC